MPFTAVVWNVEQFGARYGGYTAKDTVADQRVRLIAALLGAWSADVLVIQELRKESIGNLAALRKLLGEKDWSFDWLPGAQSVSGKLSSFAQLDFVQTANKEGYGVLWRNKKLDALKGSLMSAGQNTPSPDKNSITKSDHYLALSANGKSLTFDSTKSVPIIFDAKSTSSAIGFPHSVCPEAVGSSRTHRSSRVTGSDADIPQQLGSRRPCYVNMHISDSRSVPLVVYHAPVGQQNSLSPIYGTLMGCAVDELQTADCVYAGDFNVIGDRDQKILSTYLPTLGYADFTFTGSTVHVTKSGGGFRTGKQVFGNSRDLAFCKAPSGTVPSSAVRDVLGKDTIDPNGALRKFFNDATNKATLTKSISPSLENGGLWSEDVVDVVNFYLGGSSGAYPHGADAYTAAAILYTYFLSDHLPIVISYA